MSPFFLNLSGNSISYLGNFRGGLPNAYRQDRKKDFLLQEQGYFVLRFLAEYIVKNLNEVLDNIIRALIVTRV